MATIGEFTPRLDILPMPQRRLWDELSSIPSDFVLYGGTAVALHLGHRASLDFDFFSDRAFDPEELASSVPFLMGAEITQRAPDTLTGIVDRNGAVKVSFFGVPGVPRLVRPLPAPGNGLKVASLLDLAGMKASVVQIRAESKDYMDVDAMITSGKVDLSSSLVAGIAIYGPQFNPEITLKALSYFDDGDLRGLPEQVKSRLATAAREVDLDALPDLDRLLDDWRGP